MLALEKLRRQLSHFLIMAKAPPIYTRSNFVLSPTFLLRLTGHHTADRGDAGKLSMKEYDKKILVSEKRALGPLSLLNHLLLVVERKRLKIYFIYNLLWPQKEGLKKLVLSKTTNTANFCRNSTLKEHFHYCDSAKIRNAT